MTTKDEVRDNKATPEQEKQMAYEQALKRKWEAELLAKKRKECEKLKRNTAEGWNRDAVHHNEIIDDVIKILTN